MKIDLMKQIGTQMRCNTKKLKNRWRQTETTKIQRSNQNRTYNRQDVGKSNERRVLVADRDSGGTADMWQLRGRGMYVVELNCQVGSREHFE